MSPPIWDGSCEFFVGEVSPFGDDKPLERRHDALRPGANPAPAACIQAYLPWSEFVFLAGDSAARRLAVSLRLPGFAGEDPPVGPVQLSLNGQGLDELPAGSAWVKWNVEIPSGAAKRGLNRLRIDWPFPNANGRTRMRAAVEQLRRGGRGNCRPVFGEIYSLRLI